MNLYQHKIDEVNTTDFNFILFYLGDNRDDWRWRGHQDQCDTCKYIIEVRLNRLYNGNDLIVFEVWSFMNQYTVELKEASKYFLYANFEKIKAKAEFFVGLGEIIKRNGFDKV